jgi:hypothetical protein
VGNLSAPMLAEVLRNPKSLYILLDLQLPDGTRRYSTLPIKTPSGMYRGKIVSMGTLYRAASGVDGAVQYPRLGNIVVEDHDSQLARAFELTEADSSPVTMWLASANVFDPDDWYRLVDNFHLDDPQQQEPLVWNMGFAFNDAPLRSEIPRTPILRSDFPNAADPVIYTYHVFLAYGEHSSEGLGDKGMVPTHYVDTENGWFGPWLGWIEVPRVFLDGVIQTSGYTIIHPIIGGRQYTLIDFTTPPDPEDNPVVTADIIGYKDGLDGAGNLIVGPEALQHELVNFVYPTEDWKRGAWLDPSTAPVSVAHFSETQAYMVDHGWEHTSRLHGGAQQIRGDQIVQEFCLSYGSLGSVASIFTNDGKIGLRPNSHKVTELWHSGSRWIRYDRHKLGPDRSWRQPTNRDGVVDRLTVKFLHNSVNSDYRWSLEVSDLAVGRNSAASLAMIWSKSSLD